MTREENMGQIICRCKLLWLHWLADVLRDFCPVVDVQKHFWWFGQSVGSQSQLRSWHFCKCGFQRIVPHYKTRVFGTVMKLTAWICLFFFKVSPLIKLFPSLTCRYSFCVGGLWIVVLKGTAHSQCLMLVSSSLGFFCVKKGQRIY